MTPAYQATELHYFEQILLDTTIIGKSQVSWWVELSCLGPLLGTHVHMPIVPATNTITVGLAIFVQGSQIQSPLHESRVYSSFSRGPRPQLARSERQSYMQAGAAREGTKSGGITTSRSSPISAQGIVRDWGAMSRNPRIHQPGARRKRPHLAPGSVLVRRVVPNVPSFH